LVPLRRKFFANLVLFTFIFSLNAPLWSQERIKDFRSAGQKIALIGASTEFVEPEVKEKTLEQTRRIINRYSRTYGASSIASFKIGRNPNDQFYQPVDESLEKDQKAFLDLLAKDNAIDIMTLASIREVGDEFEVRMQFYDARIETLSKIEETTFSLNASQRALEIIVFRLMNYLDRDGYVHDSPQDFLETPEFLASLQQQTDFDLGGDEDFAISPEELSGGYLAGGSAVAGEKTPFWEAWWFWTLIGGSLLTAGGLSYYFLVVNQDPTRANVSFNLP